MEILLATKEDCKELSYLKKEIWEDTYRGIYDDNYIDNYDYVKREEKFKNLIEIKNIKKIEKDDNSKVNCQIYYIY